MFGFLDVILGFGWSIFAYLAGIVGVISCTTYAIVLIYEKLLPAQNLKARYSAEWALVTGSSSGIGKALAERLAEQGLNVVLVALDQPLFSETFAELQKKYPGVQFRKVATNLGTPGYMEPIAEACKDITVQLVFNNAGYILPGFFAETPLERAKENYECNATCAMVITHFFLNDMIKKKKTGLFAFTSSAGQYFPGPSAAIYASSKAFLTSFGISIAGEVKDLGIEVVVAHPSPVASNFYIGTANILSTLRSAQKSAVSPVVIADGILKCAGRLLVWDQGTMCIGFRLALKTIDFAFFNELTHRVAYIFSPDHKGLAAKSKLRNPDIADK